MGHLARMQTLPFTFTFIQSNNKLMNPFQINKYQHFYHAIENTANQNTGKPLYIQQYYNQPSHHAPCICRIHYANQCIFYGMVQQW